jgi:hypothetical protein
MPEQWGTGIMEYWSVGVLEYWSIGVLKKEIQPLTISAAMPLT